MPLIETVRSKDGTSIAYERRGHGPPLVMVHGSTVDHSRWGGVVSKLAAHFSLYLIDRRGRGASGDGPVYSIEHEFEDVVAVLEATRVPAFLLAHSYGAICSLEASRLTARIAQLTVPSSVSVAANATSATFTASTSALLSDQTATVTATLNGSSKPVTLSLVASVTLSALQCAAASLASNAST